MYVSKRAWGTRNHKGLKQGQAKIRHGKSKHTALSVEPLLPACIPRASTAVFAREGGQAVKCRPALLDNITSRCIARFADTRQDD